MAISRLKARRFLASIPDINEGGCLLSAYAYYLNEHNHSRGESVHIVQLARGECKWEYEENLKFINGKSNSCYSSNHFGWTYDGGISVYDCYGKVRLSRYKYILLIPQHLTSKFCIDALNYGCWNDTFERENHLTNIEQYFGLDLSEINPWP